MNKNILQLEMIPQAARERVAREFALDMINECLMHPEHDMVVLQKIFRVKEGVLIGFFLRGKLCEIIL